MDKDHKEYGWKHVPLPQQEVKTNNKFDKPKHINEPPSYIPISSTKQPWDQKYSPLPVFFLTELPKFDADSFHFLCTYTDFKTTSLSTTVNIGTYKTELHQPNIDLNWPILPQGCRSLHLTSMPRSHSKIEVLHSFLSSSQFLVTSSRRSTLSNNLSES